MGQQALILLRGLSFSKIEQSQILKFLSVKKEILSNVLQIKYLLVVLVGAILVEYKLMVLVEYYVLQMPILIISIDVYVYLIIHSISKAFAQNLMNVDKIRFLLVLVDVPVKMDS